MGPDVPAAVSSPTTVREGVIVVVDANRNRGNNMEALDWALKNVVSRGGSIVFLGVLYDLGKKKYSCFPLNMGITISGIWERLELSLSSGHGEVRPRELGKEIKRKREQYQICIQPFYRRCRRYEVKLEIKLVAGYCPGKITANEAQNNSNTRWIVLDSHLKKHKDYIYDHVGCGVVIVKGKDHATLMSFKAPPRNSNSSSYYDQTVIMPTGNEVSGNNPIHDGLREDPGPEPTLESPSRYPLSWRDDFPRAFDESELEDITNGFLEECLVGNMENVRVYRGIFNETPVIVKSFSENDERYWSMLMILTRIRHRNIMNLIGYCFTGASRFVLSDYPSFGSVEANLLVDDSAGNLSWKERWHIALEIGGSLRYLHEECDDGPIAHLSLCSSHVVFSHNCSPMLCNFLKAKWLKDDPFSDKKSLAECRYLEEDVRAYGGFLVELITGKSARLFSDDPRSLIDWAVPLLKEEDETLRRQAMDPRLMNSTNEEDEDDCWAVHHMARAALLCLDDRRPPHKPRSISEEIGQVLAVVRGDMLAIFDY